MHTRKIAVIGLGYVGLTVASAFGQASKVIGFDISKKRISELVECNDVNNEVSRSELESADILYTMNINDLSDADFYIITVPTPVDRSKRPDYSILTTATNLVGSVLKSGDVVVFESTVSPGTTEDMCIPILESASNLKCGVDFGVGYSPERINPADNIHTFKNITKIVSGNNSETCELVKNVYRSVVDAGVFTVSSIKVAEAVKVVENTQRDLNISIMNEITMILHKLDICMSEVISAAETKWNFLPFHPGLVGGLCMSTNSYLLAHKARESDCYPEMILAGRRINESMPKFIVDQAITNLIGLGVPIKNSRIGILGLSFKDNYPCFHDSKVIDVIAMLKRYGAKVMVHDPIIDSELVKKIHDIDVVNLDSFTDMDAIIVAVAHEQYLDLDKDNINSRLSSSKFVMDVRGILDKNIFNETDTRYWRL